MSDYNTNKKIVKKEISYLGRDFSSIRQNLIEFAKTYFPNQYAVQSLLGHKKTHTDFLQARTTTTCTCAKQPIVSANKRAQEKIAIVSPP